MYKVILISGVAGVGKTTLLRKIGACVDTLTQIVDLDDYKALMRNIDFNIDGEKPSEIFYQHGIGATPPFEQNDEKYAQIQKFVLEPVIKSAILRKSLACVVAGGMIPGRFDMLKFPDVSVRQVLLINSDREQHRRHFIERQKKRPMKKDWEHLFNIVTAEQDFYIDCAKKSGVQIINNDEKSLDVILNILRN